MFLKDNYASQKYNGMRKSRDVFLNGFTDSLSTFGGLVTELVKVPAKYYLEIRKSEEIIAIMTFPYDPSSVNYSRPQPTSVTYTMGGVIRQTGTIRRHDINLSGKSGLAQRVAYTRAGGLIFAEGEAVFQEFDEFFKKYIEACHSEFGVSSNMGRPISIFNDTPSKSSINGSTEDSLTMILRCIDEDLHLKVEPINFSWSKNSTSSRFDYEWNCSFIGYGYADKYTNFVFDVLDRIENEANALGGAISTVSNVIDNISNDYIGGVRKTLRSIAGPAQAIRNIGDSGAAAYSNMLGVKTDAVAAIKAYGFIADGVGDALNSLKSNIATNNPYEPGIAVQQPSAVSPQAAETENMILSTLSEPLVAGDKQQDDLATVINTITQIKNIGERLRAGIPRSFFNNRIYDLQNPAGEVLTGGEFLSNEKNLGALTRGLFFNSEPDIDDIQNNFDIHFMARDDDLKSVARNYLGEETRWVEIMTLNKWRDARRNSTGNFFTPGEKILVPKTERAVTNPYGIPGDSIGIDIYMPYDEIKLSKSNNDIILTTPEQTINQYVKNVLMTRVGEISGYKSFGIPQMPNVSNLTYAAAVVREAILRDERILDVTNIEIEAKGDTITVSCDVTPKKGEPIQIKTLVN